MYAKGIKGLAIQCCARLIDYCLEKCLIPQWGCWTANIPSCKLAEKPGFEVTAEMQVNFAEITQSN
jgi:RimJ/RimL family protein N-acetyltransferase